jgi:hypothetical protein
MDLKDFLSDFRYLPKELRDFHDQKDLFKRIQETVTEKDDELQELNWVMAHIYTIDRFLWFMAAHGYTLQRSRQKVQFADLKATLDEFRKRRGARLGNILNAEFAKNKRGKEDGNTGGIDRSEN